MGLLDTESSVTMCSQVAAWYWTVARDISAGVDALDMAAVNYAIGFAPSVRRDLLRCSDFLAALRSTPARTAPLG